MTRIRLDFSDDISLELFRIGCQAYAIVRQDRFSSHQFLRMTLSEDDMGRLRDWLDMTIGAGTSLLCPPDCPLCGKPLRAYGPGEWSCSGCGIRMDRRDPGYE